MSNNIDHDIINEDVINRGELIDYLTYLLENDGEVERFFERNYMEAPFPDIKGFKEWLEEQTFDYLIRESYFEEDIKGLFEDAGEYDPNSFLHRHINWETVCESLLDTDYDRVFEENDPFNIFGEQQFYSRIY
jgi:hypothetical protein